MGQACFSGRSAAFGQANIFLIVALSIMAGISSLFPDFPKQMSVMDRVKIIIQRHTSNYFKNWSTQELVWGIDNTSSNISTIPITILTTILYTSKIHFFLNHNTGTILVYNTGTHNTSIPVLRSPSTGDPKFNH